MAKHRGFHGIDKIIEEPSCLPLRYSIMDSLLRDTNGRELRRSNGLINAAVKTVGIRAGAKKHLEFR